LRIETGALVLDTDTRSVEIDGTPVRLTRKEFRILELLSLSKNVALSRGALLDDLYRGADDRPDIRIIDVFVAVLRKKLATASGRTRRSYIAGSGAQGFRWSDPESSGSQR